MAALVGSILQVIKDSSNREIYSKFISLLINQSAKDIDIDKAKAIEKLKTPLTYPEVDTMAFHLSLQLKHLEMKGFSLLFWQPSDILVAHLTTGEDLYILANLSQMVPLEKKDVTQLVLVYPTVFPFPRERCAPELLKMNVLPFIMHRSASYYSLALLCLSLLPDLSLEMIQSTKLFYFLERCLNPNPNERVLLYL